MAPLKSLTHIIIDRDHYYIYRPPISPTFFIYIYLTQTSRHWGRLFTNQIIIPVSLVIRLLCVERMHLMIEYYVNFKVGKTRAAEEQLLACWPIERAGRWMGGWRHKTLHASPAKCCFFMVGRRERREEKKGSHNGVLINTYNSNVLHALTGKPIERVAVCDSKEVEVYYKRRNLTHSQPEHIYRMGTRRERE